MVVLAAEPRDDLKLKRGTAAKRSGRTTYIIKVGGFPESFVRMGHQ